jgi:hypothetical protein
MTGGDQIAMPAQHRLRTHHQPHPQQHVPRKPVQHRGQQGTVSGSESNLASLAMQLLLQHGDLMA